MVVRTQIGLGETLKRVSNLNLKDYVYTNWSSMNLCSGIITAHLCFLNHSLMKNVYGFLAQKKQAKMQLLQDPKQKNLDTLNNVSREVSRHFENKTKEYRKIK